VSGLFRGTRKKKEAEVTEKKGLLGGKEGGQQKFLRFGRITRPKKGPSKSENFAEKRNRHARDEGNQRKKSKKKFEQIMKEKGHRGALGLLGVEKARRP